MVHAKELEATRRAMLVSVRIATATNLPMAPDIVADALLVTEGILTYTEDAKVRKIYLHLKDA